MASMIPYSRYNRLAHTAFPFDDLFDAMTAPVSASADFKMDVEDAGDGYVVSVFVPGVTRDQIDVELNEGRLSISIEKKDSEEQKSKNYLQRESYEYSCTRGVFLKDAATSGLSAKLADGVLTINVPKQDEKANVTKISID
jgi:HSP20 family protein